MIYKLGLATHAASSRQSRDFFFKHNMATHSTLKLTTPVETGKSKISVSLDKPTLLLGSCFADNIGKRMVQCGFDTIVNPLGTTYNPLSIANSLSRIDFGTPFTSSDCEAIGAGDGRICSFSHHTSHARKTAEEFLSAANDGLAKAHDHWLRTDLLIVTLGTAWCFRHNATGEVVSNCLKRPAAEFTRFRLSMSECVNALNRIITIANGRDVIFTVSPIRHLADGANGNQLSKSTLLLSADSVIANHPDHTAYFPSFEIMNDELRDYRFYADDMVHPTLLAETYVFDRFMDFALPDNERGRLEENIKIAKRMAHREMR